MKELLTIQQRLKAPKTHEAKNQGRTMYKYRSCEQVLELVKPLLNEEKCTLTISDNMVAEGGRFYIMATATITNEAGESVSASAFAREPDRMNAMNEAQVTGACSSYARKYALNGLFAIDDTRDADDVATADMARNYYDKEVWMKKLSFCKTEADVKKLWNQYEPLQGDNEFRNACELKVNTIRNDNK